MNVDLKIAMLRAGRTQKSLAKELGFHHTLLSMYIHGSRPFPQERWERLLEVLLRDTLAQGR